MTRYTRSTLATRLFQKALAIMLVLFAVISFCNQNAYGLEVQKFSARPNQTSGSTVVGGVPTRLTWEATTDGSAVKEIELTLPEGSKTDDAKLSVSVLDGLERLETESNSSIADGKANINFAKPLEKEGLLVRVQIEPISLDAQGGSYTMKSQARLADSSVVELNESPAIVVEANSPVQSIVSWLDNQEWVAAWNSNKFLNTFFKPQLIVSSAVDLFNGWLMALGLVALGFPLAIPLGLAFAFLRMGGIKIAKFLAGLYINIIRGTPLFLQVYIAFFGLPLLGITINNFLLGVLILAMNSSAYLAEIFRAGIQSINKGQFEAAASLGMNKAQSMFYVIIPQTIKRVIPTMTSEFILLYKDTSLLSSVGVMELMMFSKNITATTGNITPYIVAAGYYLLVTTPMIKLVSTLERKLDDSARPEIKVEAETSGHSLSAANHESR